MNQVIKKRIEDINNGIVPEGYKQTPFGIFSYDWETKSLDNICVMQGGGTPSTQNKFYWDGNIPWISSSDIKDNDFYNANITRYITQEAVDSSATKVCPANSIAVVTRVGVGKMAIIDKPYCTSQDFTNIIKTSCNTLYLLYQLKKAINRKIQECQGTSIKGITTTEIQKLQIDIPKDKIEQSKIAEILMKWDEMVELQEQYIQKLELRKKAIMKKLLTPKDGWEKYKLFELVVSMSSGGTPATKRQEYYDGDIVWVSIDDMSRAGKYIADSARKLTDLGLKNSSAKLFPEQTILYAMYASIGKTVISTVPCATSQAILGIIVNQEKIDNQYLYYYLLNMQEKIVLQGQKGTQANLNKEMVEKFDISLPKDLDGQKNISKILMNFDEEISLQKEKLDRIKIQRKAMQQYLLTGIVRVL